MTIAELNLWREKFKVIDGAPHRMKPFAKEFRNEFDLWGLKGHQIYSLLRDGEDFFQLLKDVAK